MKNLDQLPLYNWRDDEHYAAVYEIICDKTGGNYIGASIHVRERVMMHLSQLKKGKHCAKLMQKDFNNHGVESFRVELLKAFIYKRGDESHSICRKVRIMEKELLIERMPSYNNRRSVLSPIKMTPLLKKALEAA